jgi:selenide,water dikinase
VLAKPLGTGIVTTAIKRRLASRALAKKAIDLMAKINSVGAELAKNGGVRAATDITGFGLIGHLASMCHASGVSATIHASRVPMIDREIVRLIEQDCIPGGTRDNLKLARATVDWGNTATAQRTLLADAQTSGGLLLAVPSRYLARVVNVLRRRRTPSAAVIGEITPPRDRLICMTG